MGNAIGAEAEVFNERMRQSLRAMAINVWLLSTRDANGASHGLAVTNTNCLATVPPSMMVSVSRAASSYPVLMETQCFCLNMIHSGQLELLDNFSRSDRRDQRFAPGQWERGALDLPYLESALASLFCRVDATHDYGSHTVLFGRIIDIRTSDRLGTADPLIWINGGPAQFDRHEGVARR